MGAPINIFKTIIEGTLAGGTPEEQGTTKSVYDGDEAYPDDGGNDEHADGVPAHQEHARHHLVEICLVFGMVVAGLASLAIMTAMALSDDCGCTCSD